MLTLLQAVLGFDNLLYISLESKRAPEDQRAKVRRLGIGIAIGLRIILLYAVIKLIHTFHHSIVIFDLNNIIEGDFNLHSVILIFGGVFIIYTATKEILHMMVLSSYENTEEHSKSVSMVIFLIVSMNVVFSFDSILSAMALTDVFWVMATAIVIGGLLMIWLSDRVSQFLEQNRMYEVLGLFILFVVGIMLLSDGGHMAHLHLFGYEITPMSKATFYFIIGILILIDFVQTRYQKKLFRQNRKKNSITEPLN
ncbi:MAG: tellurium resistance protein TerC [Candidatus Marinimicrobia bacterium]|nr:tellurium resistance protein TerC [Candidatus Neomarinimicrobiota bacterium]|tara:strand:+ start:94 stop:852 length:759 start_codon:yes stop_codon:yes gene_type:complete